jgi:hypothetical protein
LIDSKAARCGAPVALIVLRDEVRHAFRNVRRE